MLKRIMQSIFKRNVRSRRQQRGIQLVEMAIAMPVMMLMMGATAEFARYFYTYTTLNKATRLGARYLSTQIYDTAALTATKNLVVCGDAASCTSGSEIIKGLTTSNIEITSAVTGGTRTTVTVNIINFNHTPIFGMGNFASVGVTPSTTVRYLRNN